VFTTRLFYKFMIQQQPKRLFLPHLGDLHTIIFGRNWLQVKNVICWMHVINLLLNLKCYLKDAPFVSFNCGRTMPIRNCCLAIFLGCGKRVCYTGATEDRRVLMHSKQMGILFLDESSQTAARGQKLLFTFTTRSVFTDLLGRASEDTHIQCTNYRPNHRKLWSVIDTLIAAFRMTITLPPLAETKSIEERLRVRAAFLQPRRPKGLNQKNYHRTRSFASFLPLSKPSQYRASFTKKTWKTGLCLKHFCIYRHASKPGLF